MKIDDIPKSLPPHPEEERLRKAERELATTIEDLCDKVCIALRNDDPDKSRARTDAFVGLSQLVDTATAARAAEATAIQDQMDLLKPG